VSENLPTREQAIQLLRRNGCSANVVNHCLSVAKTALKTAEALKNKGVAVDVELVEIGALLHDIGRSRTHGVDHAVEGAKIAEFAGLPKPVISIIMRHVGGGITASEAEALGWPTTNSYVPTTLEEKLVSFADKLVEGAKRVSVEVRVEHLLKEGKPAAAERVRKLHDEIATLIGDCP
jgi:uncharacterized protein